MSQGNDMLKQKLDEVGTQTALARQSGLSVVEINHLIHSRRKANLRQAVALRDAFGIPTDAWLEAEGAG